ncbi:MAG: hypothetical protein NZM44_07660, partial [Candidatus Calescibacterium sp.]|nr:hypothetical protein [Candidatus Calescibacterium sp.]
MNESQMAQIVAQILADKDYVFLPQQSYIEAVRIAFYEYSMYYPIKTSDEINIDTEQSYEYDLGSSLSNWVGNFSVVLGVEIVQSGQSPSIITRGSYLKSNYYEIEENIIDGLLRIKFLFRFKGKVKVYYTVPYQQLENV